MIGKDKWILQTETTKKQDLRKMEIKPGVRNLQANNTNKNQQKHHIQY